MNTQVETILHFVKREPDRIWFAKDFQNWEKFVWYEAGPRICDLVDMGYMEKVGNFDRYWNPGGKFAGYKLLTNPIIKAREVKKSKKQIIIDAFLAGHRTPKHFWTSPGELAEEYYNSITK